MRDRWVQVCTTIKISMCGLVYHNIQRTEFPERVRKLLVGKR